MTSSTQVAFGSPPHYIHGEPSPSICSPCTSPQPLMENPATDRMAAAIEELTKGREVAARLCKLVQSGDSSEAGAMAEEVMASLSRALNALDSDASGRSPVGDAVCNNSAACGKKRKNSGPGRGGCRKRKQDSQWRTVTSKTITDEYSWRKYGQKEIHHSKFPRSYFRCTHKYDQSCQATKQVQTSEDDPSLLVITYIGEHTCTNYHHNLIPTLIMPSTSSGPSIISFGSNTTSNITHDFSLQSSPLFPKRLENEDEVLSNPNPSTSSSEFFDLPGLREGTMREPLMDEYALQRGFDMSFMLDSFNFEDDVIAFDQAPLFGG